MTTQQSQLLRYAHDLTELMVQHRELQKRYQAVSNSQGYAALSNDLLLSNIRYGRIPYLLTDETGFITNVNASGVSMLGADGTALIGLHITQLAPLRELEHIGNLVSQLTGNVMNEAILQCQVRLFDGKEVDSISQFDVLVISSKRHRPVEYFWMLNENTSNSDNPLTALLDFGLLADSENGLLVTDANSRICMVNTSFTRITGYERDESMGQNSSLLAAGLHDDVFYKDFWTTLKNTGSWTGEFINRKKDGDIYPDWKTVKAVKDTTGKIYAFVGVFVDSSDATKGTELLSRMAYQDALTHLPNRRLLEDRASQALRLAKRDGTGLGFLYIDIDRFKSINDEMGHQVGDLVLQEISRRLTQSVRGSDTVARVGGDEFVVLLPTAANVQDIESIATTLLYQLCVPIVAGDHQLLVGGSIGCSRFPDDGCEVDILIKHADKAMYAAKRAGGNQFCFHDVDSYQQVFANMGSDLWLAIERNEMHLVYQPLVSGSGELRGCEALLRWTHPQMGPVAPSVFIPVAEGNGSIIQLGDWVLDTACRQLRQWKDAGLDIMTITVNVSLRQLRDPDFVNRVRRALRSAGIAPDSLELDVNEEDALQSRDGIQQYLQPLNELGVRLAVHNFGIGYSSFMRLKSLTLHRLKLNPSLVRDLATSTDARAVSQLFVSVGSAMGMEVVAAGVETLAQQQVLLNQGCQVTQGYLTGWPMTATDLQLKFI